MARLSTQANRLLESRKNYPTDPGAEKGCVGSPSSSSSGSRATGVAALSMAKNMACGRANRIKINKNQMAVTWRRVDRKEDDVKLTSSTKQHEFGKYRNIAT